MSQEIIALLVIAFGAAGVYLIRRSSEFRPPSRPAEHFRPANHPATEPADPAQGRVRITHPMIRRAAEQAIRKNHQAARYLTREEGEIYFDFEAIVDPADRRRALEIIAKVQHGLEAKMSDVLWLMRRIFGDA